MEMQKNMVSSCRINNQSILVMVIISKVGRGTEAVEANLAPLTYTGE